MKPEDENTELESVVDESSEAVVSEYPDFPYTAEELCKKLDDSATFMELVTAGFMERNERIFYRKPAVNTDGKMEFSDLVDNTLPSYLEKMPKNVIQKLPTFTVDAHTRNKAEDLTFEFIAKKIILRTGSSEGYGLLQKQWIELRNAATFGACAVYLPFENDHGEYTVGEIPIYWGDLFPEAYANNLNSTNHTTFRSLRTEEDLNEILAGFDTEQGGNWSKAGIEEVLAYGVGTSKQNAQNYKVQMEGLPQGMYELFVFTNRDWVAYFHYATQRIVRVIPNHSGRRRVLGLYSDYDGSSIMGRSLIDMGYGAQQALTQLLRSFIYTTDYNTDPAKTVQGISLNEDTFNLTKGNTMFLNDEDGKMDLHPIDTSTIQNFPTSYNLLKSILLQSLPSSNETLPAGSGDPNQSKTQAGVNSQDQKADIENNYYRKNYEQYFEMAIENKLNIYIAEVREIARLNGAVPLIKVDEEYANLIREVDPAFINDKNEVRLDLTDVKSVNISVDFESTRQMAKEEDLKRLNTFMTGFFEAAKSDPSMAKVMRSVMPLLMSEMTKSSNLENSAKIAETMKQALAQVQKDEEIEKAQAAKEAAQKNQPMNDVKPPTVSISLKDLPVAGKIQAAAKYGINLTPADFMGGEDDGNGADTENAAETKLELQPGGGAA